MGIGALMGTVRGILGILALMAPALLAPAGALAQIDLGTEEQRQAGKVVYDKWCAQCHGDTGDGQGIATPWVQPEPRDFTSGKYKIRSTPNGTMPTDADMERVIREGIPYTAMPGFPELSSSELDNLVYYLKSFSEDFADERAYGDPIAIPSPPAFDAERALSEGLATYQEAGCKQCHGDLGRGDGGTAPTLRDEWGDFIRAADLTLPWTFRAGGTREDIFRTLTTGFNGTPMASFADSLSEEQRWLIADWIVATGGERVDDPYDRQVTAVAVDRLELPDDPTAARDLFADAPAAHFPIIGQIMEPGRQPHPATTEVEVRAIYDRESIAFRVSWHDMAAETRGENAPDLEAPAFLEAQRALEGEEAGADAGATSDDPFGDAVVGDDSGAADDPWGGAAVADDGDATAGGSGGGLWDLADTSTPVAGGRDTGYSDAVAIQLPSAVPTGIVRPYFLLGDSANPVDLWFMDLAEAGSRDEARLYTARGSGDIAPGEGEAPLVRAVYDQGEWSVVFHRRRLRGGVPFQEDSFLPVAFSVWDGFQGDRGNRRGLTRWYSVYLEPMERPSPLGPMLRAGFGVLALELLILFLVRRRRRASPDERRGASAPQHA